LAYKAYNDILTSVVDIHALPICFPPIGRYQKTRKAALGNGGVQRLTFKEKPKLKDVRHDTFVVTRWNITQQHKCLTIYTACLFNYDDDEYQFGPVGCGRLLRGQRVVFTSITLARHRGFLAIHFVKVKWYLLINSLRC
jgi:hypothetical protein